MSDVMCVYHIRYLQVCVCHRDVGGGGGACAMIWAETVWCNKDLVYQPLNGLIVLVHVDVVQHTIDITSRKLEDVLLSSKFKKKKAILRFHTLFAALIYLQYGLYCWVRARWPCTTKCDVLLDILSALHTNRNVSWWNSISCIAGEYEAPNVSRLNSLLCVRYELTPRWGVIRNGAGGRVLGNSHPDDSGAQCFAVFSTPPPTGTTDHHLPSVFRVVSTCPKGHRCQAVCGVQWQT